MSIGFKFLATTGLVSLITTGIFLVQNLRASDTEYVNSWGNTSDRFYVYLIKPVWIVAIPFMPREVQVKYPDDFHMAGVRNIVGIKSVEMTTSSCEASTVQVIRGGVGYNFATVRIDSAKGCGINCWIYFYDEVRTPDESSNLWRLDSKYGKIPNIS